MDAIGRWYNVTDDLWLPSVTTILSNTSDDTALKAWRQKVGEENAKAITKFACDRGSIMHSMLEHSVDEFAAGRQPKEKDAIEFARAANPNITTPAVELGAFLWRQFPIDFYTSFKEVVGQEIPIWSKRGGGYAGRFDLMVRDKRGDLQVIDFKTTKKPKRRPWIRKYELQLGAYSVGYYDKFGEVPKSGEIWMASETGGVEVYEMDIPQLKEAFLEFQGLVKTFHSNVK